ncbi:Pyridine nucleotide-disulphide oxidoreductase [Klenkia marina]|uniref:Pyridine nucleotide-disulphide oxidoreductase n=1 Tax=Klenkia marina TaxID=1960309 RepID=A0A1G4Y7G7_9ACTN|nr:NAD(P)-binding protein [Klenkia marina]SCX49339.1 Pyridine nucleotide-disulphide oxidoreductase [Klenkia marina]
MLETDYLVVGAGATGLAFVDTLLAETDDVHVTLVDRRSAPGGHWVDAYSFVTLHQPSAFYGVGSLELGTGRIDTTGLNRGMQELASGPAIVDYYDRVVRTVLLPTGRVGYHPLSAYEPGPDGAHRVTSLLSGAATEVRVRRKLVDTTHSSPSVPATHRPRFAVADGVHLVPPNDLPRLPPGPHRFVVLGGGKTAMDTCTWLLQHGAAPEAITWVVPRDSWLINRITTQPGPGFFAESIGAQADQLEALASADDVPDLFARLERCGVLTRIDRDRTPSMFHLATVAPGEVELLRQVHDVVRLGRVRELHPDRMVLDGGEVPLPPGAVVVDCTASAVEPRPGQPVFQGDRVVPQLLRLPQPAFSAALTGWVEAHHGDDQELQNELCAPVPFPHALDDYPATMLATMRNQHRWSQHPELRRWIRASRLDGFGAVIAGADREDPAQQAVLARFREHTPGAVANLTRLTTALGGVRRG